MTTQDTTAWSDYELLDSGHLKKYERFGTVRLVRPEPLALWTPVDESSWNPDASFEQNSREGSWNIVRPLPEPWTISWDTLTFGLHLSSFKHVGLFPEQASNWREIQSLVSSDSHVLNLFGYTGGATLAALSRGAEVVHVDASKPALSSGKRNVEYSQLPDTVRWIADDAKKFVDREGRRDHRYDLIVMDPPAFGRGPKGELWEFENDLVPLLHSCRPILKDSGSLFVNAYSMGFPAIAVEQAVRDVFGSDVQTKTVELGLKETTKRAFLLPAGVTVRARL